MIYVIGTGCYSDWDIIGYTTELEKAVSIVNEMNKKAEWSWDEAWVKPLDEIETDVNNKLYIEYCYSVRNGVEQLDDDSTIEQDSIFVNKRETRYVSNEHGENLWICIRSNVERDKVLKICRDEMARQRAEREGL